MKITEKDIKEKIMADLYDHMDEYEPEDRAAILVAILNHQFNSYPSIPCTPLNIQYSDNKWANQPIMSTTECTSGYVYAVPKDEDKEKTEYANNELRDFLMGKGYNIE